MEQSNRKYNQKTLLFLGRLDPDTSFDKCLDIYRSQKNWSLVVAGDGPLRSQVPPVAKFLGFVADPTKYIKLADYVFTTGYLGILEAFYYKKIVLAAYSNPLKRDYLMMHPMSSEIWFSGPFPAHYSQRAYKWATAQTWNKLAEMYETLWSKSR